MNLKTHSRGEWKQRFPAANTTVLSSITSAPSPLFSLASFLRRYSRWWPGSVPSGLCQEPATHVVLSGVSSEQSTSVSPSRHCPLKKTFCSSRNFSSFSEEEKFSSLDTALHFRIFLGTRAEGRVRNLSWVELKVMIKIRQLRRTDCMLLLLRKLKWFRLITFTLLYGVHTIFSEWTCHFLCSVWMYLHVPLLALKGPLFPATALYLFQHLEGSSSFWWGKG